MSNVNQNAATVVENNAVQQVTTPTSQLTSMSVADFKAKFDIISIKVLYNEKTGKNFCVVNPKIGNQFTMKCQGTYDHSLPKAMVVDSTLVDNAGEYCLINPKPNVGASTIGEL